MLRNYWVTAWRNLMNSPWYAGANIAGLAIGFAAAILIGLYLRDEFSYDRWIRGYRQVYRVALQLQFGNVRQAPSAGAAAPTAGWLRADFSQIAAAGRMQADSRVLRRGTFSEREVVYWTDPELFAVLPLPALSGNPRTALQSPDGIVLTRSIARKYFGRNDLIGQTLLLDGRYPFRVGAVLEDLPEETHLNTSIFISARSPLSALPPVDAPSRLGGGFAELTRALTYIRLRPGTDPAALQRALPGMMLRHVRVPRGPNGKPVFPLPTVLLEPLTMLHFIPAGVHSMKPASSLRGDEAIAAVGALILLIAGFNFVNLTTARSARRATEVAIRKAVGARATDLLLQFLGESMLAVIIAVVVAAALAELLLPSLDAFLGRRLVFAWWHDPQIDLGIGVMAVAMGVLGGLYPALVLSRFRPAPLLKSAWGPPEGRLMVREALIVLQFAILIGLVLTTSILYRQTRFAENASLRFDTDQVLEINTHCRTAFPDQVRMLPGVRAAACSGALFGVPGAGTQFVVARQDGLQAPYSATIVPVDPGLLELLGLKPLAGRFFSKGYQGDAASPHGIWGAGGSVVINQRAVRQLGFASPLAAIGHAVVLPGQSASPLIVGVAPDVELEGVRHEIQPTFFRWLPEYRYLMVKLDGEQIPETLKRIDALWARSGGGGPIVRSFLDRDIQALYLDVTRESEVFSAFAGVAILVAMLGLLGLSMFTAEQRTKEIGIRKAMGASNSSILWQLLWQFGRPVAAANLLAWPITGYLMARWLDGFSYHVPLSWWLFVAAGLTALALALVAVGAHAWHVAQAQPVIALRYE